jgi:hypothetical protein
LAAASSRYFRANYAVILFQPLSFHMKMAVRRPTPIPAAAFRHPRENIICNEFYFGFLAAQRDTVYQGCGGRNGIGAAGCRVQPSV